MDDVRRSPLAAAVLNLTGLGLGYAYLERWWRQALHLLITAGLVVIAFVSGAAALPWLWVAVAALWLGWMAVDGWRIARGWFTAPADARGHALPVAVALVAVAAVVTGYVLYGAAGRSAFADAEAARDRGDCVAAERGFGVVTSLYELTLSPDVARAEAGGAECAAFLAAEEAEGRGDFAEGVRLYRGFRDAHPDTALAPFVDANLRRTYDRWGTALRASGEWDEAVRVYRELLDEVTGDPTQEAAAREQVAATYAEQAADLRGQVPTLTGDAQVGAVRMAVDNMLVVQREFPGTQAAATAAQGARDTYAAAAATWAGRSCEALPLLEYAVTLPDPETAGTATAARTDQPRALFECGLERYAAGSWADAAGAFDQLVTAHPADPQVAQARANAIAARSAAASGTPPTLPGPYAGDTPGSIGVTFYNDNPAEVRVYVVGPTAHEFVIPGCGGCPAGYATEAEACPSNEGKPSFRLELPAGTYSIVGEYPSADPTISSTTLEGGFVYTNCLYVVGS